MNESLDEKPAADVGTDTGLTKIVTPNAEDYRTSWAIVIGGTLAGAVLALFAIGIRVIS